MRTYSVKALLALFAAAHVCVCAAQSNNSTYNFTLQLPTHRPAWAEKLSPTLASFSIEMDRWPEWAGTEVGKPNEYFNQLLRNLGERTGQMPMLRVGANSEDRATIDLNVPVSNLTFPAPTPSVPNPEADHILIGRDFYSLSGNLPPGTSFMWGLAFKSLNITETVAQAALLAEAFQGSRANLTKHVKLVHVEIGNEPDFYGLTPFPGFHGPYGAEWNPLNYSTTWVEYARAVAKEIDFGSPTSGGPTLSPGAFTGFNAPEWTPEGPLQAGLLDAPDIQHNTSQFTEHAYSGGFDPTRIVQPGELMNKLSVRANMSAKAGGRKAVRATGLKYVLGETNSYANHGQPGLSNTVESALWAADWLLLGASSGVERLHFTQGIGFRYNSIQPITDAGDGINITRPHILPSYHAFLIVNEAIGKSGNSYVAEIPTSNQTLTAYGIWEEKQLCRIVVLNTQVYVGTGEKPSINVQLVGLGADFPATVKLLLSEKTTAYTGVTWAGQSFETASGKPEGAVKKDEVIGGSFNLPASSIALLHFGER